MTVGDAPREAAAVAVNAAVAAVIAMPSRSAPRFSPSAAPITRAVRPAPFPSIA